MSANQLPSNPFPAETRPDGPPSVFGGGDGSEQPSGLGLRAPTAHLGDPSAERTPPRRPRLESPNMGQLNRPIADGPQALNQQPAAPDPLNPHPASPQPVNPPNATQPGGNQPPARAKRPRLEAPNMGQLNRPLNGENPPNQGH